MFWSLTRPEFFQINVTFAGELADVDPDIHIVEQKRSAPLRFHTCFKAVDVCLDETMEHMATEAALSADRLSDAAGNRAWERWMHATLLSSQNLYNTF